MGVDLPQGIFDVDDDEILEDDIVGQSISRKDMRQMPSASANAMLGELETRSVEKEDYETAAQMRDIRKKING